MNNKIILGSFILNIFLANTLGLLGGLYWHEHEKNTLTAAHQVAVQEVDGMIRQHVPERGAVERRVYAEMIVAAASEHGLSHKLLASVAIIESRLRSDAISHKGAMGVMQIMPRWWVGTVPFVTQRNDLLNPEISIRAGAWVLAHYAELCGPERMLRCYESGPRAIDTGYTSRVEALLVAST